MENWREMRSNSLAVLTNLGMMDSKNVCDIITSFSFKKLSYYISC